MSQINGDQPTATVNLDVDPPTAKVFLNGVYIGRASKFTGERGGLPLTHGMHLLRIEAEGYLTELIEVETTEGEATIEVRMLERPQADEE